MIAQSLQADRENPGLFRWGEPFYWITQTITWHTGVESDLKYLPPQGTSVCGSTSGFSLGEKKKKALQMIHFKILAENFSTTWN